MYHSRPGNNKSREARAASEVIIDTTPSTRTRTPTAHQLARMAFKERQAGERARSIKTWDQMTNKGSRNGKNSGLPKAWARVEARDAERAAKTGPSAPLDASVGDFDGDEKYMASPTGPAEVNLMDIIKPARAFASERARYSNSIPDPLLVPGSFLSLDDYLFEDSIPAELIAELFHVEEAVLAARPEDLVDVDSDRTDANDVEDAIRESNDKNQSELATV